MTISSLTIILTIAISAVVTLISYFISLKMRKTKYEHDRILMDSMRSYLEKQIYVLNDRLLQSEERWKDVNHLLLRKEYLESSTSIASTKKTLYSEFLKANGVLESDLIIDNRLVFVLTPFNDKYYSEFMTIKEICSSMGFTCIRGDEKQFKGDIFPEMLKYMLKSRVIIANINGRNPNVLYELGVAQALDKNVLLVSKEPKDLPIDIQSQRFLIYSDSNSLGTLLKSELQKLL